MGKVRFDELRLELGCIFRASIQEYDVDYVIPNVSFAFHLLKNGRYYQSTDGYHDYWSTIGFM